MPAGDYEYIELLDECKRAGWRYGGGLVNAIAVSLGENTARNLTAVYTNPDGSRDRGPWQINSRWQPWCTDACAFELACSTRAAFRIYTDRGNSFSAWSAYANGRYEQFLDIAYLLNSYDQVRTARDVAVAGLSAERAAHASTRARLAVANEQIAQANVDLAQASEDRRAMTAARDAANTIAIARQVKIDNAMAALR